MRNTKWFPLRAGSPKRMIVVVSALATLAIGVAACSSAPTRKPLALKHTTRSQQHELALKATVAALSQASNGYAVTAKAVTVPESRTGSVAATDNGFVAVAPQVGSKPGDVVGYVMLKEGTHHNVVIPVHDKLTTGSYYLLLGTGSPPSDTVLHPLAKTTVVVTVT
jgi:hypothetical protein